RPRARRGCARRSRAVGRRRHRGGAAADGSYRRRRCRQSRGRRQLDIDASMIIARSVHPLPGESERRERLLGLIDGFSSRRVLVVGDLIADEFIYGAVARVSREAPVLILKYDATQMVAGGAGNAANNVAALGARARLVGLAGADPEGKRLLAS